jgi:hypothetical protein
MNKTFHEGDVHVFVYLMGFPLMRSHVRITAQEGNALTIRRNFYIRTVAQICLLLFVFKWKPDVYLEI